MPIDSKHAPYARETALCVDLAYEAMEGDIRTELEAANDASRDALIRVLERLRGRREVLADFTQLKKPAA